MSTTFYLVRAVRVAQQFESSNAFSHIFDVVRFVTVEKRELLTISNDRNTVKSIDHVQSHANPQDTQYHNQ